MTGLEPDDIDDTRIAFPIHYAKIADNAEQADIDQAWNHTRNRFRDRTSKFREEPLFSGYLTTIEQLQPFNNANPSIWGTNPGMLPRFSRIPNALERLARLDNTDKHRVPHVTWASIAVFRGPNIDSVAPPGFKSLGGGKSFAPLENHAEVGNWRFETPLPSDWQPSEMDMKRCFPLQVAFGDPLPFAGVVEVLELCLWGVEAVLQIFRPVFGPEHGPPLPVTAIQEPLA